MTAPSYPNDTLNGKVEVPSSGDIPVGGGITISLPKHDKGELAITIRNDQHIHTYNEDERFLMRIKGALALVAMTFSFLLVWKFLDLSYPPPSAHTAPARLLQESWWHKLTRALN